MLHASLPWRCHSGLSGSSDFQFAGTARRCGCAGERPPLSEDDWRAEFAKYRASPEFQRLNSRMTLGEFKFIYWMEYAHRMWGRALGLVFAVPGAYFVARGYITRPLAARLAVLFAMGGAQVRLHALACAMRWIPPDLPSSAPVGAGFCRVVDGAVGAAEPQE